MKKKAKAEIRERRNTAMSQNRPKGNPSRLILLIKILVPKKGDIKDKEVNHRKNEVGARLGNKS